MQEADLLLTIGSRIDTSITTSSDADFAKSSKHIIVDIDKIK